MCRKANKSINQSFNQSNHKLTVEHIFVSCSDIIRNQYFSVCSLQKLLNILNFIKDTAIYKNILIVIYRIQICIYYSTYFSWH